MSAPFGGLSRIFARLTGRSLIEAGGGGRRWEGAAHLHAPAQSALAARSPAKARASAAYVNTPYGNRITEVLTSNLVGQGYQARSQHPDRTVARRLNDDFEAMIEPHLIPAARALVRDGEAFIQIITEDDGGLRLKQLPADQIDPALSRDLGDGRRIVAGVEFDAADRVIAYHVLREAPGAPFVTYGDALRIPAADMLHIFDPIFPGQVRGLSWLSPVLLKLRDRDEASDALLMQMKVASLFTAFIRDPEGGAAGFEQRPGGAVDVSLEPGVARVLPPGADVTFSQPGAGLTQAVDFLRAQDREIAAGAGITFEALTGDMSQANYSSARVGLLEFRRRVKMLQKSLIEVQLLRPLWRRWIDTQSLAGRIEGAADLADYRAVRFIGPGWQWVDPQNEVAAEVAAIEAGLKSREEVVAGRGRDLDELDEEIARDRASAGEGTANGSN